MRLFAFLVLLWFRVSICAASPEIIYHDPRPSKKHADLVKKYLSYPDFSEIEFAHVKMLDLDQNGRKEYAILIPKKGVRLIVFDKDGMGWTKTMGFLGTDAKPSDVPIGFFEIPGLYPDSMGLFVS